MSILAALAVVAVVSFVVTYAMVPFSVKLANVLGAVDQPSERRIHAVPTARMGGVAIFAGIILSLGLAFGLGRGGLLPSELRISEGINPIGLAMGTLVVFITGCVDDVKQISPKWKLLGQIVGGAIVVASGAVISDIKTSDGSTFVGFGPLAYLITIFYLVAFSNIMNLIDGLDGLATGVCGIAATAIAVLSCATGAWAVAAVAIALTASCLAFLRFNFHPAKLFMGDSGSLTLGFLLGVVSLMGTMRVSTVTSLAVPVIIAGVPVLDTFAAIVRRKRSHVSVGQPDKGHIHHGLLNFGFSQRRVVLTIYAICAAFAVSGIVITGGELPIRLAVVGIDLAVAAFLVWKLELFGKVLGRYCLDGRPSSLFRQGNPRVPMADEREQAVKILVLCEHFHPSVDACSKRMTVLVEELRSSGHDVSVLASETSLSDVEDDYVAPGYVTFYPTYKMAEKTVINRLRNNWSEMWGSKKAAASMGGFDVVICTSPPLLLSVSGISIARKAHAKLVFDVRDIWPDVAYEMESFAENSIYGMVFRFLANRAYKKADLITTVSQGKVSKLKGKLSASQAGKVYLVPNGLDLGFLRQEECPELAHKYRLDEDPPCVYVGNLGLAQGLTALLHVAKDYPAKRFLLFGSGAEEKLLRAAMGDMGLGNVFLCGRTNARGAYTVLKHAACAFVSLKSSNMTDSVPTKLYEALGCGCPVLLAAQGDSAAILRESGLGLSAPPEDLDSLKAAFGEIVTTNWSKEQREAAAIYIQENHSRQRAAKTFGEMLAAHLSLSGSVQK